MKRFIKLILTAFTSSMLVMLAACGGAGVETGTSQSTPPSASSEAAAGGDTDKLVIYFSWSGNTKSAAQVIQSQTGADIFEIVPETPYPSKYDDILDTAKREKADKARPAIAGKIENLDKYTTVYVGYPNWWGDMPMIMYSMFDEYDFSGKTVAPFVTSGGSGLSGTVNAIKKLEPEANVRDGLALSASKPNDSEAISKWLAKIQ